MVAFNFEKKSHHVEPRGLLDTAPPTTTIFPAAELYVFFASLAQKVPKVLDQLVCNF
jgi:hypothetical protein